MREVAYLGLIFTNNLIISKKYAWRGDVLQLDKYLLCFIPSIQVIGSIVGRYVSCIMIVLVLVSVSRSATLPFFLTRGTMVDDTWLLFMFLPSFATLSASRLFLPLHIQLVPY